MASSSAPDTNSSGDVFVCFGTRREAITMAPVVRGLEGSQALRSVVFFSGRQPGAKNLFRHLGGSVHESLSPRLRPGTANTVFSHHAQVVATAFISRIGQVGREPLMVLVHGGSGTSLACAVAASWLGLPVGHVEAGVHTFDVSNPFPREQNRQAITRLASYHFAPTEFNQKNLIAQGVQPQRIIVTGNTGIDQLLATATQHEGVLDPRVTAFITRAQPLIVATAPEQDPCGGGVEGVGQALADLAVRYPKARIVLVLPAYPAGAQVIRAQVGALTNVLLTPSLGYPDFVALLKRAAVVITDSGAIQEEASCLGVHAFVTRDKTERTEGLKAGVLTLVGTDPTTIVRKVGHHLDACVRQGFFTNPFGDGRAAGRIVKFLDRHRIEQTRQGVAKR